MAKKRSAPKQLKIGEFYNLYGVLNDLAVPPNSPIANRRTLSTTTALSEVIEDYYTPDALKDKDAFLGIVLASIPTLNPRMSTKSQEFEIFSTTFSTIDVAPIYYRYKVLIPELENKCLDLNKTIEKALKKQGIKDPMTMLQRISTMADVGLDTTLYNAREAVRAIQSGTLVKVEFEDLARLKGPKITAIYKKIFNWNADGTIEGLRNKFDDNSKYLTGRRRPRKAASGAYVVNYLGDSIEQQEVENGSLPQELLTKVSHQGRTVTILKEMENDLRAFAAAYETALPGRRFLMGQSYRRLGKNAEDKWTQRHLYKCYETKPFEEGTEERTWYSTWCTSGNKAAVPGTSRHGWGAAVDMKTTEWEGSGTNSEDFKWLNANAATYNFVFNVGTEKWHISWTRVDEVFEGIRRPGAPWVPIIETYAESSQEPPPSTG